MPQRHETFTCERLACTLSRAACTARQTSFLDNGLHTMCDPSCRQGEQTRAILEGREPPPDLREEDHDPPGASLPKTVVARHARSYRDRVKTPRRPHPAPVRSAQTEPPPVPAAMATTNGPDPTEHQADPIENLSSILRCALQGCANDRRRVVTGTGRRPTGSLDLFCGDDCALSYLVANQTVPNRTAPYPTKPGHT